MQNFNGPIEDRIAIRELIDSYADATTRGDGELWASLWADDAEWHFPHLPEIGTISGRDSLVEMWRGSSAAFRNLSILAAPGSIQVEGDKATVRINLIETYEDAEGRAVHGRPSYLDLHVRREGRWMIRHRTSFPRTYSS